MSWGKSLTLDLHPSYLPYIKKRKSPQVGQASRSVLVEYHTKDRGEGMQRLMGK